MHCMHPFVTRSGDCIPLHGLLQLCPHFFGVIPRASQQLQLHVPLLGRAVLASQAWGSASDTSPHHAVRAQASLLKDPARCLSAAIIRDHQVICAHVVQ